MYKPENKSDENPKRKQKQQESTSIILCAAFVCVHNQRAIFIAKQQPTAACARKKRACVRVFFSIIKKQYARAHSLANMYTTRLQCAFGGICGLISGAERVKLLCTIPVASFAKRIRTQIRCECLCVCVCACVFVCLFVARCECTLNHGHVGGRIVKVHVRLYFVRLHSYGTI